MTVLDQLRDLGVERTRSWLIQDSEKAFLDQQMLNWSTWYWLPTVRLEKVLERCEVDHDLEQVVEYILQHPESISQTLFLLDSLEEVQATCDIRIGELLVGSDADGTSQLELYARIRGSIEDVYRVREYIHRRFEARFREQSTLVVVVILRKK